MSLETNVSDLATAIATELKKTRVLLNGNAATLGALTTTAKSDLVAAINEVAAAVGDAGAQIDDATISTLSVWSSDKTDAEIEARVAAIIDTAPGTLDTLNELAAALGDDPNFATTISNQIATKAPIASPTFTGVPAAPTAAVNTNTTQVATTAFVQAAFPAATELVAGKVELATTTEATTGLDTARAVTPAGLKAVADTKAASGHGHALTDANITGILPIAQVPTGTSGTTVALGNHTHTTAGITDYATATDARINTLVPAASETAAGKLELATVLETTTGTDTARAVTPAGVKAVADTKANTSHTHTASQVTDFSTAADARINTLVVAATDAVAGKVELATTLETTTGTDTVRAVTPAGLKAVADTKANTSHTHTASQVTDFTTSVDSRINTVVVAATDAVAGKVELATNLETTTGTDTTRAVTPAGLKAVADTKANTAHSHAVSDVTGLQTALDGKAPLASPALTGTPTAPTAAAGTSSTQLATTAFAATAAANAASAAAPLASDTVAGKIEIATDIEAIAGVSTLLAITPASLAAVVGDSTEDFVATFNAGLV